MNTTPTSHSGIELLLQRQSNPSLTAPAPSSQALELILQAGMKAPDHGALTPWLFTVITGQGLSTLSDIYQRAAKLSHADEAKIEKAKNMPFRAPMIIVISTQYTTHSKVPKQEQLVAAGCAAHAMQMAAFTLGYGAMWRTGDFSYNDFVKQELNINENEDIVGFLYIGSVDKKTPTKPIKDHQAYTRYLN